MRSILKDFAKLWPDSRKEILAPILSKVSYLKFPEDAHLISIEQHPEPVIIVTSGSDFFAIRPLILAGYRHFVNRDRSDFAQELLASCLMISRPPVFVQNPVPYFLAGFNDAEVFSDVSKSLSRQFRSSTEKIELLGDIVTFLDRHPKARALKDLCVQTADELITNAMYNAPTDETGGKPFRTYDRIVPVEYENGKTARLFACCTEDRVTIGCEDPYGSIKRSEMTPYLRSSFNDEKAIPREGSGGAGLGLKMIMDNSANFYLFSDRGFRTIVAGTFVLTGMKTNLSHQKHFHWSIN